jgi:hypothetical protein
MTLVLLPDVARLVSGYLRTVPEVVALVGDRVYTAFPAQLEVGLGFVLVQRIGGEPAVPRPLVVDTASIQLDAYGGPQALAHELAATCRAALAELRGEQPDGNVCGVLPVALRYVPDETWKPPRPRYIADLEVTVKPPAMVLAGAT